MPFSPKPGHLLVPGVAHGGPDYRALLARGLGPADVLDFSASVNPFPPPPEVAAAAGAADFTRYPDDASILLRKELARRLGRSENEILVTSGASEALGLIGLAFIRPGARCLVLGPAYGEYARTAALHGGTVLEFRAREEDGFRPDISLLEREIDRLRPEIVFACSPNNPTGILLGPGDVGRIAEAVRRVSAGLVLDEAYLSFCGDGGRAAPGVVFAGEDVLVLRSMTKDYNLPGARLGYVLAPARTAESLKRVRTPWSVSAFAQAAGLAALAADEYYRGTWKALAALSRGLREDLGRILRSAGEGDVLPGEANFLLVRLRRKKDLLGFLAERRIVLRDCSSFGLDDHVRIGVRTEAENARLSEAVRDFAEGGGRG